MKFAFHHSLALATDTGHFSNAQWCSKGEIQLLDGRRHIHAKPPKKSPCMFSAVAHKKLLSAKGYFTEHLAQNDYYAAGEIRPGEWIGIGAQRLGLNAGENVTREQFYALCDNKHPQSGEQLTQRQR